MKKALILIKENKICQVADNEFPVHKDLKWVDCDDDVAPSWEYDGKKFNKPFTENLSYNQLSDIEKLNFIRTERNARLLACDWTQLLDSVCDKKAWATYRQALRDLPENITDINNPIYPIPPM